MGVVVVVEKWFHVVCVALVMSVFIWACFRRFLCTWSWQDIASEVIIPVLWLAVVFIIFKTLMAFAKAVGLIAQSTFGLTARSILNTLVIAFAVTVS